MSRSRSYYNNAQEEQARRVLFEASYSNEVPELSEEQAKDALRALRRERTAAGSSGERLTRTLLRVKGLPDEILRSVLRMTNIVSGKIYADVYDHPNASETTRGVAVALAVRIQHTNTPTYPQGKLEAGKEAFVVAVGKWGPQSGVKPLESLVEDAYGNCDDSMREMAVVFMKDSLERARLQEQDIRQALRTAKRI